MSGDHQKDEYSRNSPASSFTVRNVRYGACMRNHAAEIGGYALDGCREFMATGEEGTEAALVCAACGCHRSYHRRLVETAVVNSESNSSVTNIMSHLGIN